MKLWTKPFNCLAALLIIAALTAACGGDTAPTSAPQPTNTTAAAAPTTAAAAPTTAPSGSGGDTTSQVDTKGLNTSVSGTFSYWNGFTASDRPVMEDHVKTFGTLYKNVTVKMDIQPWDSILPKLLPSMKSGSDPDVVSLDSSLIPQYVTAGVLAPVDDLWAAGGIDSAKFSPGLLKSMTIGDHKYGAPIIYFTTLLYMNNDLFKKAGLDATCPATWDAWQTDLLKLTLDPTNSGTPQQYGMSWGDHGAVSIWPSLVWSGGGDFISADGTKSMLDDPKTIAAVQKWADLINKNHILALGLSGVEADNLFQTGKAAMTVSGPWVSTGFKTAGVNFQVCQMPAGPAGRFTQGAGVFFVVNKNTKAKDAVYELMKFWQTDWAQVDWSSKTGFAPPRTDLASNAQVMANPNVKAFSDSLPFARTYLPGVVEFSKIDTDIIVPAILQVARGQKTADVALKDAATKMNAILAKQK